MKKIRKYRRKTQKKILIIGSLSLLIFLCVGYAAFSTQITLTAKGNIKEVTASEFLRKKCNTTTGDGLYKDEYEEGRCIYKGVNPNNYILLDAEVYRIVAIEKDNRIKIVKNDIATNTINFDDNDISRYNKDGYCTDSQGCNAWASNKTLLNTDKKPISYMTVNGINYELPETEAKANRYLNSSGEFTNSGFYNNLSEDSQKLIVKSDFAIGSVSERDETNISHIIKEEQKNYWNGYIGLLNLSDFAKANSTSGNYLANFYQWYWLINPMDNSRTQIRSRHYGVESYGTAYFGVGSSVGLIPSFYICSDIKLSGSGTELDPYIITN